jgi:putative copper export protein
VKLALFAAMVGLAAANRLRRVPGLHAVLAQGAPPELWLGRVPISDGSSGWAWRSS